MRDKPDDLVPDANPSLVVVRALARGVALLQIFSPAEPRLSLAVLSRRSGLDKGTTRRLLHTLVLTGLVESDSRTGEYYLSANVIELASAVETGREFRTVSAPWLADVAEKSGASAFLWIHHSGTALCIDRVCAPVTAVSGNWPNVGTRLSMNLGAAPRVLLSWLDEEERAKALNGQLEIRTPQSETSPARLRAEVENIRMTGWALAIDDFVVGLSAVGVPVFTAKGQLAGAISITGLTNQIMADGRPLHIDLLLEAAHNIGKGLF